MNKNEKIIIFKQNQNSGTSVKNQKVKPKPAGIGNKAEGMGNQPPKKKHIVKEAITNILLYSPKKNIAKIIPEYSTLYPATISASASGKSKGALLVSAKTATQKMHIKGKNGKTNQTLFCASTILYIFNDPVHEIITKTIKLIEIS